MPHTPEHWCQKVPKMEPIWHPKASQKGVKKRYNKGTLPKSPKSDQHETKNGGLWRFLKVLKVFCLFLEFSGCVFGGFLTGSAAQAVRPLQ